jgi:hypothetical protein
LSVQRRLKSQTVRLERNAISIKKVPDCENKISSIQMETKRKQRQRSKIPVKSKSDSIQLLKSIALAHSRTKHPTLPEGARCIHSYSDRTANGLTRCILDFLKFSGHQAERISSTGRYLDNSKVVTDVLGSKKRIGSGQWIPGSGTIGTADISATIWSRSIKIEVKMNDQQSPGQKQYQQEVERAGGKYWLCRTFDEFLDRYHELI